MRDESLGVALYQDLSQLSSWFCLEPRFGPLNIQLVSLSPWLSSDESLGNKANLSLHITVESYIRFSKAANTPSYI